MSAKTPTVRRFWNWTSPTPEAEDSGGVRVLHLNGAIAEESWFDDEITPSIFKEELHAGSGDVEVRVNSPGGDCIAAAQIYNKLTEYPGRVTVIIDGLAASSASVIAMAAATVVMSPVSLMIFTTPQPSSSATPQNYLGRLRCLMRLKNPLLMPTSLKLACSVRRFLG